MLNDLSDRQPDEQERAHAQRLLKRIKFFSGPHKERCERWKRARSYVDGRQEDDGQSGLVRTNLIGSSLAASLPAIYAKAPEIEVRPSAQVEQQGYEAARGLARTLEVALNQMLVRDAKLKTKGRAVVRAAKTCTTGWLKLIYQRDKRADPLIQSRINDAQDNVLRIETLIRETEDEGACSDHKAKLSELRQQIGALQQRLEIVVSEGLVADHVPSENIMILDASVLSIDDVQNASAIAHRVYMTAAAFKAQFGIRPPSASTVYSDTSDSANKSSTNTNTQADDDDRMVCVWEVWSKDDQTVYTLVEGAQQWVRAPFQPETLGEQWYPFFALQLGRVDGVLYPRSAVEALIELQDEFNTRRTNAASHRRKNRPVRLLNKASTITDADVTRINNRTIDDEVIGVEFDPDIPLQNALGSLPEIPYNPAMYDTTDILQDFEMVSGTQDAARGFINKAKTLGEAEIMQQNLSARVADDVDAVEDWLTAVSIYAAQLLLQNVPPQKIKEKFGDEATWPAHPQSKEELFEMVGITIRAGSTAKPNKAREREQWVQLMPQIKEAVAQIAELEKAGNAQMSQVIRGMVDETLRRFDERMSINDFLGRSGSGDEAQNMMGEMQAKLQQATDKLQEMQGAIDDISKREADLAAEDRRINIERQLLGETQRRVIAEIKLAKFEAEASVREQRRELDDAAGECAGLASAISPDALPDDQPRVM